MRTTKKSSLRKLLRKIADNRWTPPPSDDRAAFRALQAFALAEGDVVALAERVNATLNRTRMFFSVPYGMANEKERRSAQHRLRAWFEQMQTGRSSTLAVGGDEVHGFALSYQTLAPGTRHMVWRWNTAGLGEFWIDVAELMVRVGPAIRQCAHCGAVFLRSKRQIYCTARCSQVARSARWYRAHRKQVRGKRRQAYETQIRAVQPRARVGRKGVTH